MPLSLLPELIRAASGSRLALAAAVFVLLIYLANLWFAKANLRLRSRIFGTLVVLGICIVGFMFSLDTGAFRKEKPLATVPSANTVTQTGSTVSQSGGINVNAVSGTVTVDNAPKDKSQATKKK
jgi:hypothetical protein